MVTQCPRLTSWFLPLPHWMRKQSFLGLDFSSFLIGTEKYRFTDSEFKDSATSYYEALICRLRRSICRIRPLNWLGREEFHHSTVCPDCWTEWFLPGVHSEEVTLASCIHGAYSRVTSPRAGSMVLVLDCWAHGSWWVHCEVLGR